MKFASQAIGSLFQEDRASKMTTCVLDFYRHASPRGIPLKQFIQWTTSSTTTMTVSPPATLAYFVKSIGFLINKTADFGANSLNIIHSSDAFGGVESTTLSFADVDALIAGSSAGTPKEIGCQIKSHIVFDVPILLLFSTSQTLTISYSGSGLTGGQLNIVASGWSILEADL